MTAWPLLAVIALPALLACGKQARPDAQPLNALADSIRRADGVKLECQTYPLSPWGTELDAGPYRICSGTRADTGVTVITDAHGTVMAVNRAWQAPAELVERRYNGLVAQLSALYGAGRTGCAMEPGTTFHTWVSADTPLYIVAWQAKAAHELGLEEVVGEGTPCTG